MSNREELLRDAISLVDGDRNVDYGDPTEDFQRTSDYWNIHLKATFMRCVHEEGMTPADENGWINIDEVMEILSHLLRPMDVAIMMAQLKMSRLSWSPHKYDHWVDLAGYAACGWDCVARD